VLLGSVSVYPLAQLVRMSLSDVTITTLQGPWRFLGLGNFIAQAKMPLFWASIKYTVIFVVIVAFFSLFLGFVAAIALRGRGRYTGFLLGLAVFVWALPPVVSGSVWKFLLAGDGLVNQVFMLLGLDKIPFLYDPKLAIYSVAVVNTWAVIPFATLVFRAALLGIPAETIEAARIDGATPFKEIVHVIVPQVRPTIYVLGILTVVYAFRSFDFIYVMTAGGPGTATNTLAFLGYSLAFVQYRYGMGAAVSVVSVLLVIGLAFLYSRSVFREEKES